MLDEKRIKEAESNVRNYLRDGMIKKEFFNSQVFSILLRNSSESLEIAEFLKEKNKSPFWIIITSYYSMFYIANAVLYKLGYKIGDKIAHKVTADSLVVFVRNKLKKALLENYEEAQEAALAGIKADSLLEQFDLERDKRGRVQYQTTELELNAKAQTSLQRAKEFRLEMEKLI